MTTNLRNRREKVPRSASNGLLPLIRRVKRTPVAMMRPALLGLSLAALLLAFGCASPDVNPTSPGPHTGYVDLYADFSGELSWDVQQFDTNAGTFKKAFYNLRPLEGRILRLAFAPGPHKLRVTFLNQAVIEPAVLEVEVREASITPVRITLAEVGGTSVPTKEISACGTVYGRYGRRTKIGSYETVQYSLSAAPAVPIAYQPKEQMRYGGH